MTIALLIIQIIIAACILASNVALVRYARKRDQ